MSFCPSCNKDLRYPEDTTYCVKCHNPFCEDCTWPCQGCDEKYCEGCQESTHFDSFGFWCAECDKAYQEDLKKQEEQDGSNDH